MSADRHIPVFPTILVVAAAAIMVALGFWQLDRMEEKEALIASYEAALETPEEVDLPAGEEAREALLYRRTTVVCVDISSWIAVAGTSADGRKGFAQRFECYLPEGQTATVDLGFSERPEPVSWGGGIVRGMIAPGGRIVASSLTPGLEPLARPDPADVPNNHLAYAVQWFVFALTALVIYWLALRRRWRDG